MTDVSTPPPPPPTGRQWITTFAAALGVEPPDETTIERLLELAGVAAHASERLAAPIACYMVGRAGTDASAAIDIALHV